MVHPPRLVWTENKHHHHHIDNDTIATKSPTHSVNLFDIQHLKKADTRELENFPYAMPGLTVSLHIATNGGITTTKGTSTTT
jgi:hypothetical protein